MRVVTCGSGLRGGVQSIFFLERVIEIVAGNLGMTPMQVREKNFYVTGQLTPYLMPIQ